VVALDSEHAQDRIYKIFPVNLEKSCNPVYVLPRNREGIVAQRLVEFHFLDAVLREEGALRHLEALREAEGD
jgi:hypothetical protein